MRTKKYLRYLLIKGGELYKKAIDDIKIDDFAKKVITFRGKYSAHLEMTPLSEEPARFLISELNT